MGLGPTEASGRKATSTDAEVWIRVHRRPPIIYIRLRLQRSYKESRSMGGLSGDLNYIGIGRVNVAGRIYLVARTD